MMSVHILSKIVPTKIWSYSGGVPGVNSTEKRTMSQPAADIDLVDILIFNKK